MATAMALVWAASRYVSLAGAVSSWATSTIALTTISYTKTCKAFWCSGSSGRAASKLSATLCVTTSAAPSKSSAEPPTPNYETTSCPGTARASSIPVPPRFGRTTGRNKPIAPRASDRPPATGDITVPASDLRRPVGLRRITPLNALYWLLLFAYLGLWGRLANQYPILFDDGSLYSMAYAHNAGATFFDGLVENRPPLLMTAVAWVFQVAPDVRVIRWLSVVVFAGVLGCVYLTLRFATGRKDVSICGVTLLATNYAVRDYGIVEISLSFWQASMCLCVLVLVFRAVALGCDGGRLSRQVVGLLLAAGMLWGAAFFTKQQSIVVLPALIVVVAVLLRGQQWEHAALALVTFIAAAAISVSALYYFLLAGAGIDDTYKYLVAANMHRNAAIPWDVAWWSRKAGVATDMLVMSSRIALGSIVALEFLAWIERASPRLIIAFGQRSSEVSNTRSPESVFRQRTVLLASGVAVWVVTAVTFYFFQINAHAHYLLEIGVAVALLAPLGLAATARYSRASIVLLNAAILAAMFVWHGFVREPV